MPLGLLWFGPVNWIGPCCVYWKEISNIVFRPNFEPCSGYPPVILDSHIVHFFLSLHDHLGPSIYQASWSSINVVRRLTILSILNDNELVSSPSNNWSSLIKARLQWFTFPFSISCLFLIQDCQSVIWSDSSWRMSVPATRHCHVCNQHCNGDARFLALYQNRQLWSVYRCVHPWAR